MGLPAGLLPCGTEGGFPSAVALGAGSGGVTVGGGGGGWLRAVLCPQAESKSTPAAIKISATRVEQAFRPASLPTLIPEGFSPGEVLALGALSASSGGCWLPSCPLPASSSRWQCAVQRWNGRGSPAPARR